MKNSLLLTYKNLFKKKLYSHSFEHSSFHTLLIHIPEYVQVFNEWMSE